MKVNAKSRLLGLFFAPVLVFSIAGSVRAETPIGLAGWTAAPSDGVSLEMKAVVGEHGPALRLEFDFHGGGGYAVVRRPIVLAYPENWRFQFWIRGEAQPNNLEFKLIDRSGDNVWWVNRRGFRFQSRWQPVTIKKRHVAFAWGPQGGGPLEESAALELAITTGEGGQGWIEIADLVFEELPRPLESGGPPKAVASAAIPGAGAERAVDGDPATGWRSPAAAGEQSFLLDWGRPLEFGGVEILWDPAARPTRFALDLSLDGTTWDHVRQVDNNGRELSPVILPEAEARFLRLRCTGAGAAGCGIREMTVKPLDYSASLNAFFTQWARRGPRGAFPRYLWGEPVYWTVAGVSGDTEEALLGEDGAIEPRRGGPVLEPFLWFDGRLQGWESFSRRVELAEGRLPIPTVIWESREWKLEVTALAAGEPGASTLYACYRVTNLLPTAVDAKLFIALRPFQVNPPAQNLGIPGGVSSINKIGWDGKKALIDGQLTIIPLVPGAAFGAAGFDQGDLHTLLSTGLPPPDPMVEDPAGLASGVFGFPGHWASGEVKDFFLAVPFHAASPIAPATEIENRTALTLKRWRTDLSRVAWKVPPPARQIVDAVESNLAFILINRDGPAIQPGSRAYARSWIRDGALTCSALLRLGHPDEVRQFLHWFAGFQYSTGKVPCCVDQRGADPVPENDSAGEFLYLVHEYYRFTRDRETASALWPHVEAAFRWLETLRGQRRTAAFAALEKRAFFGLLPESISHEGYSDKPVHSYWDDFFAYAGYTAAVELADALGKTADRQRMLAARDEFAADLFSSIQRTIAAHQIDFIPGSVEKGDFDPTSTSIVLDPTQAAARLPQRELRRTFSRYWESFSARRNGSQRSINYTPYEWRNVGALVRLGEKQQAWEAIEFFFKDRRPPAWNQWPEVVWTPPDGTRFLGDLPHTWVGSDFIRSILDLVAFERADHSLVLGAGLPAEWLTAPGGFEVAHLGTPFGPLNFRAVTVGGETRIRWDGLSEPPPGGIVLRGAEWGNPARVWVDGRPAVFQNGELVIRARSGEIRLSQ